MKDDDDLIPHISELNMNGYYDKTNGYITVWFHNSEVNKPDVVAYLKANMQWDVREVVSEYSQLYDDREVITVKHKHLGNREIGSNFDIMLRKMIDAQVENTEEKLPESVMEMKRILDNNSYDLLVALENTDE